MSNIIAVAAEGLRLPIPRVRVAAVVRDVLRTERVSHSLISVTFVSNRVIRRMNREHLRRDRVTDVIAFGLRSAGRRSAIVGDIYIAADVARASAAANRITVREELTRLVVHGTLHVLGYDHPASDARTRSPMWRKQERVVARLMA